MRITGVFSLWISEQNPRKKKHFVIIINIPFSLRLDLIGVLQQNFTFRRKPKKAVVETTASMIPAIRR